MAEDLDKLREEAERLGINLEDIDYGREEEEEPEPGKKDSLYQFFRELLRSKDSRKTGNLNDTEIGRLPLTVRSYLRIGNYAQFEGLDMVSEYYKNQAEIVSATSMSKKGFLSQLFVTQIKKQQKIVEPSKIKKPWYGRGSEQSEQ